VEVVNVFICRSGNEQSMMHWNVSLAFVCLPVCHGTNFFTIEKNVWVFVSSFLFYYFCLGVGKTYVMRENVCLLSLIWRVKKRKRNGRKGLWCAISGGCGAHKRCVQRAIQGPTGPMCVSKTYTQHGANMYYSLSQFRLW
jgi:hypothetical protein